MPELILGGRQARGLLKILFKIRASSGIRLSTRSFNNGEILLVRTDEDRFLVDERGRIARLSEEGVIERGEARIE